MGERRYYSQDYAKDAAWQNARTLEDYVRILLDQGKKSSDPEFQHLFNIYGKEKIVAFGVKYLEEKKQK